MRRLIKIGIAFIVIWWLITNRELTQNVISAPVTLAQGAITTIELHNLEKFVQMKRQLDGQYPSDGEFQRVLETELTSRVKSPSLDGWGNRYAYHRLLGGYEIRSAGPDRLYNSDDDLVLVGKDKHHENG